MSVDTDRNISPQFGTSQNDSLVGTSWSEVFSGGRGDDLIYARSGSDEAFGGSGDDTLHGESGDDVLYGGGGPSYVNMGQFKITENYTGTVTFLDEGAGYRNSLGMYRIDEDGSISDVEILFANASKTGSGGSLVPGESSVEVELNADSFPHINTVTGEVLLGFEDLKNGGDKDYDDTLFTLDVGTSNAEVLDPNLNYGENTNDQDTNTGDGDDSDDIIIVTENDILFGGDGADTLFGMAGNDLAYGGDGNDVLNGGNGKDYLNGDSGDDQLNGGDGKDRLLGETGSDILTGGDGQDQFIFRRSDTGGYNDIITDFEVGTDVHKLSGFDFDNLNEVLTAPSEVDGTLILSLGETDTITFESTTLSEFNIDDVILF